jgi:DivIVA domain-containing protein
VHDAQGPHEGPHEGHGHDGHGTHAGHGHAAPDAGATSVVRLHADRGLLTPAEVRNKIFATVRVREGYDMAQVDTFLDQVESTLSRVLQENAALRAGPAAHHRPRGPAGESAPHIVALAQEAADRAIGMAEEEARAIIADAHERADAAERAALDYGGRIREGLQSQIHQLRVLLSELETRAIRLTDGDPDLAMDAGGRDASPGMTAHRTTG